MPLDPIIARGLDPIGRDLPQVAGMLQERNRYQQLLAMQQKHDADQAARQKAADARQSVTDARETTKFSQEQQITNTKLLAAAAAEIAQNPAAAERWIPQLKQAGIIRADFDIASIPPEQLQAHAAELYKSTSAALAAMEPQKSSGTLYPTTEGLLPAAEARGKMPYRAPDTLQPTADSRDFAQYQRMSPEQRALYDNMHGRPDKPTEPKSFEATDTNSIRGLVTTAFGGFYDPVSGNITGIKKEDARNLNRVTAKASQVFKANPGMPHAQAVEQAFAELQGPKTPPAAPLPDRAKANLKEGVETPFNNGQVWTLKNGSAVRIR